VADKITLISPDNLVRNLVTIRSDNPQVRHVGVGRANYSILLSGSDTLGKFCLFDMFVPPEWGPPPHRHDFEETFIMLEGQLDVTFRARKFLVKTDETVSIPSNAPHQFQNSSNLPARVLCICSPSGLDEFFLEIGVRLSDRTTLPPELDEASQKAVRAKAAKLAPLYKVEFLEHA
jgi:uncharacterized cupin superfamily protein